MTTSNQEKRIPEFVLGDRLRAAREKMTGLGQREFAELIGVSHQTITNAEKGHRSVRKITLNAWALATGVPVEWLEFGIETTPPGDGPGDGAHLDPGPVTGLYLRRRGPREVTAPAYLRPAAA